MYQLINDIQVLSAIEDDVRLPLFVRLSARALLVPLLEGECTFIPDGVCYNVILDFLIFKGE